MTDPLPPRRVRRRMETAAAILGLAMISVLSACETHYPDRPPLREVESGEDRLFLWCLSDGIYRAAPECRLYVGNRDR